jgi:dTDP-glucose 4,6-dehydratase
MKTFLVTGGAGFIGSNFVRYILKNHSKVKLINLDKLTYSGNLDNLRDIEKDSRYAFIKGDIADKTIVNNIFKKHKPDIVVNFAAETHVDRSIHRPDDFIKTDVYGAFTLLEASRAHGLLLYIQISTDEVYGHIPKGSATEKSPLMPTNPYSASKAGADRLCYSYFATYKLPVIITRASNNYGPYQYPEKLIPLFITNALENNPLPLYGDGLQMRDWLYVEDHCDAINFLITNGTVGEVYNVGGGNLYTNSKITNKILSYLKKPKSLIKHVTDRPGHDRRYSLSIKKAEKLGWRPKMDFNHGFEKTIDWYISNTDWWKRIKNGEFKKYYSKQYSKRDI